MQLAISWFFWYLLSPVKPYIYKSIGLEESLVFTTGDVYDSIREAIQNQVKVIVVKMQLITSQSEYIAAQGTMNFAWRANIMKKILYKGALHGH